MNSANTESLLVTAIDLVKLHMEHAQIDPAAVPGLIEQVYGKLAALNGLVPAAAEPPPRQEPAVLIEDSVTPDGQWVICLEDGKRFKMMKRHLRTVYNMTPAQYRAKWGLPIDHPIVAPAYKASKSDYAKHVGLGTEKLGRGNRRQKRNAVTSAGRRREVNVAA